MGNMENIKELKLKIKELQLELKKAKGFTEGLISKKIMALEVYNARRPYFTILIACMFWILITAAFSGWYAVVIASIGMGLLAVKIALEYKYLEYLRINYNLKVKSIKQSLNEVSKNLEKDVGVPPPVKAPKYKEV